MKVLHLHAGVLYGGVETFLVTLARKENQEADMDHVFATCFESRLTDELRAVNADSVLLPGARFSRPWTILQARMMCNKLIRKIKPDVIIGHMAKSYWLFAPVAKRNKIPIVLYLHSPVTKDWVDLSCRQYQPELMIGVSQHTLQTGKDLLFSDIKSAIINYPMPFASDIFDQYKSERADVRAELQVGQDIVIFQATRMDSWKGHRELIEALGLLKEVPNWVFVIAGGPQNPKEELYYEALQEQAKSLGIADKVRFLGRRKDVPRLLVASDIYCQANTGSEGFSLSFTEAFSAGLPVVTTDIGSASEVVPPEVGVLTPVRDAPALASALRKLIENKNHREALGAAARAHIVKLSATQQQIHRIYTELLELT